MNKPKDQDKRGIHSENESIAFDSLHVDGNVGNLHIGHTKIYQFESEEEVPLTSDEIENGLRRFAEYLPERAPILKEPFESSAKRLRATLGVDSKFLSATLKSQRENAIDAMKSMSLEVLDISFPVLCRGQNPPPYDSRLPFRGLYAFQLEDREFYFGREELIQKLAARLEECPFLAVLGASGTGKSSLVMAGLIPALNAKMAYFTPSSVPLYQLHAAKETADSGTVLVVDQFEELFTLTRDQQERSQFISELLALTKTNRVVITMRADFLGEVATYEALKEMVQEHQELIPPMSTRELHAAMQQQAAAVELSFDQALRESILEDVKDEPGAMPLLQHALWLLWQRRHGRYLKAEEYQNFGGVKQAIAHTAEEVYGLCSEFEQERIRDIFLRLTRLDESRQGRDTRRRVSISDLTPAKGDRSVTIHLLNKLANKRLIVKTETNEVEVAHEALIRHWKRLVNWLQEDRENLHRWENLSEAARDWEKSGRSEELLNLRGTSLELTRDISRLPRYQLNPTEQAYLEACVTLREREIAARENERKTRLMILSAGIIVALVLAGIATFQLFQARAQAKIALAGQLAAQAQSMSAKNDASKMLATLLAVRSMQILPSQEAADVLLDNNAARLLVNLNCASSESTVALSSDGNYLICEDQIWNIDNGEQIGSIALPPDVYGLEAVAISPTGDYVASGYDDGTVLVSDITTGKEIAQRKYEDRVNWLRISPDGEYVVSGIGDDFSSSRLGYVWEWRTDKNEDFLFVDQSSDSVAFSPDGKYVFSADYEGIQRWDTTTGELADLLSLNEDEWADDWNFSQDARYAAASNDGVIQVWDLQSGKLARRVHQDTGSDWIEAMVLAPDNKYFIAATDTEAFIWEIATGKEIGRIPQPGITSLDFSADSKYLVAGGNDRTVRVWETSTWKEVGRIIHDGDVHTVMVGPEGTSVVSSSGEDTLVWEIKTDQETANIVHHYPFHIQSIDFIENGRYAISNMGDFIRVWQPTTGQEVRRMRSDHDAMIYEMQVSPDGKYIVFTDSNYTAQVWEIATGKKLISKNFDDFIRFIAFTQNGERLVTQSADNVLYVWETLSGEDILHRSLGEDPEQIAFSPSGDYAISTNGYRDALLEDIKTGKIISEKVYQSEVISVAFSSDGKYAISASREHGADVWEVPAGKELLHLTFPEQIDNVSFSSDGKRVLLIGNNMVALWDVQPTKKIALITLDAKAKGISSSWVFSQDGSYFAVADEDGVIQIWNMTKRRLMSTVSHDDAVNVMQLSTDNKYLLSGSDDKTARVWEMSTGNEIARMTHPSAVNLVAFSPDGKYIISSSELTRNNSTWVWQWRPTDLIANACSYLPRNLTPNEWNKYMGQSKYEAVCPNLPIQTGSESIPGGRFAIIWTLLVYGIFGYMAYKAIFVDKSLLPLAETVGFRWRWFFLAALQGGILTILLLAGLWIGAELEPDPSLFLLLLVIPSGFWAGGAFSHFTRGQTDRSNWAQRLLIGSLTGLLNPVFIVALLIAPAFAAESDWLSALQLLAIVALAVVGLSFLGSLIYILGLQKWAFHRKLAKQTA